jgi:hypothetical protein
LNYLVFFFKPGMEQKDLLQTISQRYSMEESLVENVQYLFNLRQVNRSMYELLSHTRMNVLWKSSYSQLGGKYNELKNMKKTSTQSLTQVVFKQCIYSYPFTLFEVKMKCLEHAVTNSDLNKCIDLLCSNNKWILDYKKEQVMNILYSMNSNEEFPLKFIEQNIIGTPLESLLLYGNFITYMVPKIGHSPYFSNFIQILNSMRPDNRKAIVDKNILYLILLGLRHLNTEQISQYRTIYMKEIRDWTYIVLFVSKSIFMTNSNLSQISLLSEFIGQDEYNTSCLKCVIELVKNPSTYGDNFNEAFVNNIVETIDKSVYLNNGHNTVLHTLIEGYCQYQNPTQNKIHSFCLKFKDFLGPMTMVKNNNRKLPIELLIDSLSMRYVRKNITDNDRIQLLELLVDLCPDIKLYRTSKIELQIKKMTVAIGDDKNKYNKIIEAIKKN